MATPKAETKAALEETQVQRQCAFLPKSLNAADYLSLMKERLGGREHMEKEGGCPYDTVWRNISATKGVYVYNFSRDRNRNSEDVCVTVKRGEVLMASLSVVLPPPAYSIRNEDGETLAPVPRAIVREQKCRDSILEEILKTIAPPGLENISVSG